MLLSYCCLNCCISRLQRKDAPDRGVLWAFIPCSETGGDPGVRKLSAEMDTLANETILTTSGSTRAWRECQTQIDYFCCKNSASAQRSL